MEEFRFLVSNLNSIGLCLDIIGVLMLFKFGLPEDVRRDGAYFLAIGKQNKEAEKAKRYDCFAKVALMLIVVGFILQFIHSLWF